MGECGVSKRAWRPVWAVHGSDQGECTGKPMPSSCAPWSSAKKERTPQSSSLRRSFSRQSCRGVDFGGYFSLSVIAFAEVIPQLGRLGAMSGVAVFRPWIAVLSFVALTGCAVSPVIVPGASKSGFEDATFKGEVVEVASPTPGMEQFRVFEQGATGFVPLSGVMEDVEHNAAKFCEKRGATMRAVKWRRSVPPHIMGNFPRAELLFECHPTERKEQVQSAPQQDRLTQLERLKKLLDSGALTQQEYDAEKARILK